MGAVPAARVLELNLSAQRQLFNSMDPAPFRERDLDPDVVSYIVDWAEKLPADAPLGLVVTLGTETLSDHDVGTLRESLVENFRRRALAARRRVKRLFRDGRISLLIGVVFVAAAILVGDVIGSLISHPRYATLVQETVVIGAWVALWHPINIFLYEWWPIRAEARLFDRLAEMDMRLCSSTASLLGRDSE
jgi:hypothetical protein